MKYWHIGGIIGAILGFVTFVLYINEIYTSEIMYAIYTFISWNSFSVNIYVSLFVVYLIWMLLGALIGLIIGKIKEKIGLIIRKVKGR